MTPPTMEGSGSTEKDEPSGYNGNGDLQYYQWVTSKAVSTGHSKIAAILRRIILVMPVLLIWALALSSMFVWKLSLTTLITNLPETYMSRLLGYPQQSGYVYSDHLQIVHALAFFFALGATIFLAVVAGLALPMRMQAASRRAGGTIDLFTDAALFLAVTLGILLSSIIGVDTWRCDGGRLCAPLSPFLHGAPNNLISPVPSLFRPPAAPILATILVIFVVSSIILLSRRIRKNKKYAFKMGIFTVAIVSTLIVTNITATVKAHPNQMLPTYSSAYFIPSTYPALDGFWAQSLQPRWGMALVDRLTCAANGNCLALGIGGTPGGPSTIIATSNNYTHDWHEVELQTTVDGGASALMSQCSGGVCHYLHDTNAFSKVPELVTISADGGDASKRGGTSDKITGNGTAHATDTAHAVQIVSHQLPLNGALSFTHPLSCPAISTCLVVIMQKSPTKTLNAPTIPNKGRTAMLLSTANNGQSWAKRTLPLPESLTAEVTPSLWCASMQKCWLWFDEAISPFGRSGDTGSRSTHKRPMPPTSLGTLLITANSGRSWKQAVLPKLLFHPSGFACSGAKLCWAWGQNPPNRSPTLCLCGSPNADTIVLSSQDGGVVWRPSVLLSGLVPSSITCYHYGGCAALGTVRQSTSAKKTAAVHQDSAVALLDKSGTKWTLITLPKQRSPRSMQPHLTFSNPSVAWRLLSCPERGVCVVGGFDMPNVIMLATYNNGATWSREFLPPPSRHRLPLLHLPR